MAFDVDGTLFVDRTVSPQNVEALKRWQDAGHLAVCNTGKSLFANRLTFAPFDIRFDYHVLFTGAVVTDADFKVLLKRTLPREVVLGVFERVAGLTGVNMYASTLEQDYLVRESVEGMSSMLLHFEPLDPAELACQEFLGLPLWVPQEELRQELFDWLTATYSGQVSVHRNQDFLDVVPPGCDKGTGMRWLVEEYLGGQELTTYTLGDSWNDLGMHRVADYSASFSYSPQQVQDETDLVVDHAHEFIDRVLAS